MNKNIRKSKNVAPRKERNPKLLFGLLEKNFPGWIDYEYIKDVGKFNFLMEKDLKDLTKAGFLDKQPFEAWDKNRKLLGYNRNHYRLTPQGFNFLNSLRNRRTNILLIILTIIMTILVGLQIYRLG